MKFFFGAALFLLVVGVVSKQQQGSCRCQCQCCKSAVNNKEGEQ